MPTLPLYQVDAFASEVFRGNPAAVCPLEEWLPDRVMAAIAAENNLSETAFFVPDGDGAGDGYSLRWFTPKTEVELCGHATLASAWVIFEKLKPELGAVSFASRGGPLGVRRDGDLLELDFPTRVAKPADPTTELIDALGGEPVEVLESKSWLVVYARESEVAALAPNMDLLAAIGRPVIVSAPGDEVDFVSRFFAPSMGVPEDPVTGAAHCTLTPYWARRLGKDTLRARQVSKRGGELRCELAGARTRIAGRCVLYLEGRIHL